MDSNKDPKHALINQNDNDEQNDNIFIGGTSNGNGTGTSRDNVDKEVEEISENVRNFNFGEVKQKKRDLCKFFRSKTGCKNGSKCPFIHDDLNWREQSKEELKPSEIIARDVKVAILNGSLNDIFYKMLTDPVEYKKYYSELVMQFRGIAIWKLNKKSIKRDLFELITTNPIELSDDIYLEYGYLPFCLHFVFKGMAWKVFDGACDVFGDKEIEGCIDEVIDIVSTIYSGYDYNNIIREMVNFVHPSSQETILHVATYYLCDKILAHIKSNLGDLKYFELRKEYSVEELNEMKEDDPMEYDNMINEEFNKLVAEKNKENQNVKEIYEFRKNNQDVMKDKYKAKLTKALSNVKFSKNPTEKEQHVKSVYKHNVESIEIKLKSIYNELYPIIMKKVSKFANTDITHLVDKLFNSELNLLLKSSNRFGTPIDMLALTKLIDLIKNQFSNNMEEKLNLVLAKFPIDLFIPDRANEEFRKNNLSQLVWKFIINTISSDNPLSYCPPLLLDLLMNEPNLGKKEAYIGEYVKVMKTIKLSIGNQQFNLIIDIITSAKLDTKIINRI